VHCGDHARCPRCRLSEASLEVDWSPKQLRTLEIMWWCNEEQGSKGGLHYVVETVLFCFFHSATTVRWIAMYRIVQMCRGLHVFRCSTEREKLAISGRSLNLVGVVNSDLMPTRLMVWFLFAAAKECLCLEPGHLRVRLDLHVP